MKAASADLPTAFGERATHEVPGSSDRSTNLDVRPHLLGSRRVRSYEYVREISLDLTQVTVLSVVDVQSRQYTTARPAD